MIKTFKTVAYTRKVEAIFRSLIGILYTQTRAGSRDFLHGAKARAGKTKYREGAGVVKPYLVGAGKKRNGSPTLTKTVVVYASD